MLLRCKQYTQQEHKRVLSSLRVIRVFEKLHPECMGFGSAVSEDAFKCHDYKKEQQAVFCGHL